MSKETIHRCDLCKAVIKGRHATLTIPKPPKAKKDGLQHEHQQLFVTFIWGSNDGVGERQYDVCLPCAAGLLRFTAPAKELREMEEA